MSDALPKVGRKITKGGRDFGKFMAQCTRGVIENTKDAWELHSLVIFKSLIKFVYSHLSDFTVHKTERNLASSSIVAKLES